ncbi:MAG: hypothetical protein IKI58_00060 [Oscillospiraceae bacterium]|nr:hypothetical protein [Oscillospiraceae bacterium]
MNTLKRYAALLLAGSMLLPAFACSKGKNDSSSSAGDSSSSSDFAQMFDEKNMVTDANGAPNFMLDFNDNIAGVNDEDAINAIVTTIRGDDGKIYVPRTDINGTTVTQADGKPVTDVYTGTTLATTYASPDYVPKFRNYMALWLDISKGENFVFDGNLLEYEMEIAQDAPSGVYPIEFTLIDMGDYDGKGFKQVDWNPGYVCINADEPTRNDVDNGNLTLTAETISAKPGETARMKVKITNNTGIVAFRIMIRFDSNVISIKNAGAGKDLASFATLTARTIDDQES